MEKPKRLSRAVSLYCCAKIVLQDRDYTVDRSQSFRAFEQALRTDNVVVDCLQRISTYGEIYGVLSAVLVCHLNGCNDARYVTGSAKKLSSITRLKCAEAKEDASYYLAVKQ